MPPHSPSQYTYQPCPRSETDLAIKKNLCRGIESFGSSNANKSAPTPFLSFFSRHVFIDSIERVCVPAFGRTVLCDQECAFDRAHTLCSPRHSERWVCFSLYLVVYLFIHSFIHPSIHPCSYARTKSLA